MPTAISDQPTSTSLASRPSFFGGFVSTRQASALPSWKPVKPAEAASSQGPKQGNSAKASAATAARPASQAKVAPPPDPGLVRKERLKSSRNFDSDSDTEADKQQARQQQNLERLEQKLAAADKEAAAKRPAARPQHAQQAQQQRGYSSPYNKEHKPGSHKARTVLPKGKAGAASRNMALAPQAIGLSRKQMADRGIRQAVDSVRNHSPTQATQRPAAKAALSNPGRTANSMGNSMENSMGKSLGRINQGSSFQPPSRPPVSNGVPRAEVSQAQGQRQSAPAGQMPAWMQKAKQAVMAGRGAKRMRPEEPEYDDDFVVDDDDEPDWRQALKSITKYDPSKFDDRGFDDRSMEANYKQIQAEERRSARMGREDDRRAEEEELRHEEEKRRKKKKAKANKGFVM